MCPRRVPVLPQPTPAQAATDSNPPITLQIQNKKWKVKTYKPASFLVTISCFLATFFQTNKILRYCKACHISHSRRTLCFPATVMNHHHLQTLKDLLDRTLTFTWTDDEHLMVFSLSNYFLLDEQYILPMFKASPKLEYAFCYDQ